MGQNLYIPGLLTSLASHLPRRPLSVPQRRSSAPSPLALRLRPKDRIFRASAAPPRRRSDGGAVPGLAAASAATPPSLASRLAPSPASSAHRPTTLRTHLPLPSRLCCSHGSPASCPGWPGLGSAGASTP